jgi:hypothetical protein
VLELLHAAEKDLPSLLARPEGWRSYQLDRHPPRIDRMLRQYRDGKLYLHRIHACAPGLADYHRHPWPSAMRLVEGSYELALGYGAGERPPEVAVRRIVRSGFEYEMIVPHAWHSVRAIDNSALTIMVTGPRWSRRSSRHHPPQPLVDEPIAPLEEAEIETMLEGYWQRYPRR